MVIYVKIEKSTSWYIHSFKVICNHGDICNPNVTIPCSMLF